MTHFMYRSDKRRVGQMSGRTNFGSDKLRVRQTSCFSPRSDKRRIFSLRLDKWRFLVVGRTNVGSDSRTNCGSHFWRSQKPRIILFLWKSFGLIFFFAFVQITRTGRFSRSSSEQKVQFEIRSPVSSVTKVSFPATGTSTTTWSSSRFFS